MRNIWELFEYLIYLHNFCWIDGIWTEVEIDFKYDLDRLYIHARALKLVSLFGLACLFVKIKPSKVISDN